jgi:hypothetical protein
VKLFDPARPLSDGIPLYVHEGSAAQRSLGLPVIYVSAGATEGEWIAGVHMPNSHNAFGGYETKLTGTDELTKLFLDWLADPERVISEVFRYTYNAKANLSRAKSVASARSVAAGLAELGLDDL